MRRYQARSNSPAQHRITADDIIDLAANIEATIVRDDDGPLGSIIIANRLGHRQRFLCVEADELPDITDEELESGCHAGLVYSA